MAAMGIITELVRKSKKSRNCIPRSVTPESGPYPREESVPSATRMTDIRQVAFLRLQPSSS